jgi:hypothetical protein
VVIDCDMFFRVVVVGFALGILLGGVAAQSSPTSIDNPALVPYSVKGIHFTTIRWKEDADDFIQLIGVKEKPMLVGFFATALRRITHVIL